MSWTPNLSLTVTSNGVLASDDTVYDAGGIPARNTVDVNFQAFLTVGDTETEVTLSSYDEDTVQIITITTEQDGLLRVVLTVTDDQAADHVDTEYIVTYENLLECRDEKLAAFLDDCCDEISKCETIDLLKINLAIDVIDQENALERYENALCVLNGIAVLCQDENCNGC